MGTLRWIMLALTLLPVLVGEASAASYCWFSGSHLVDGGRATETLRIVVSSVPREFIPGRPANRPWCVQSRTSFGGNSANRVVEQPRLGTVRANGYRIAYKGDRIGKDRFVIERTWRGPRNELFRGVLTFDIDVVAAPF